MVAKSLDMDKRRSSIIWRLSLNSAPVMQKVIHHFEHLEPKCSVHKVLRLIKDIKNVALEGNEKNFLKSYIVKQAMLWCVDENPTISTEADLLMSTIMKIVHFYQQENLPSFLEPNRNLIFKFAKNKQLEVAKTRVIDILTNVESYLDKIKDVQANIRKGISEVRNHLAPVAPILLFPLVSQKISEQAIREMHKGFKTSDGTLHFYFEESEMMEIMDEATKRTKTVTELESLQIVLKNWADAVLIYVTKKESVDEQVMDEDTEDEENQMGTPAATDLVNCIASIVNDVKNVVRLFNK